MLRVLGERFQLQVIDVDSGSNCKGRFDLVSGRPETAPLGRLPHATGGAPSSFEVLTPRAEAVARPEVSIRWTDRGSLRGVPRSRDR